MIEHAAVLGLLDHDEPSLVNMASGYADAMTRRDEQFALSHVDGFPGRPLCQARLLQVVPDLHTAWEKAKALGADVDAAYWREFSIYGRGDFQLLNDATRNLLDHNRPADALELMSLYLRRDRKQPDPKLIMEAFKGLESQDGMGGLSAYSIQELMSYLRQTSSDSEEDEVALLEWRLLPALGHEPHSLFLERKLARDPAFFVEMLSMCFRRKDSDETLDIPQEVATNAYQLLRQWHTIPGRAGPGQPVDAGGLNAWYAAVKPLLIEAGRLDIGEQIFGQTLAHAPADDDDLWPNEVVRSFMERVASAQVEIGFRIECFNKRGVVSRSLDEGGRQEYALAERYTDWADRMAVTAPRTAAILRSLAEGYRRDGLREDEEAKMRLEGFGG